MNRQRIFDSTHGEMCNHEQEELLRELKASEVLGSVTSLGPVELE